MISSSSSIKFVYFIDFDTILMRYESSEMYIICWMQLDLIVVCWCFFLVSRLVLLESNTMVEEF